MQHSDVKLFRLSFTGRAECLRDVNVFMSHALSNLAISNFIHSYSAKHTEMYEGEVTMVFQCPEQHRAGMKQAVTLLMEKLEKFGETDDLHVLCETINFSDEYTEERDRDNQLTERLINRMDAKMIEL
jgi:hypothetical protein